MIKRETYIKKFVESALKKAEGNKEEALRLVLTEGTRILYPRWFDRTVGLGPRQWEILLEWRRDGPKPSDFPWEVTPSTIHHYVRQWKEAEIRQAIEFTRWSLSDTDPLHLATVLLRYEFHDG